MTTQTISEPVVSYFFVNDVYHHPYWDRIFGPHHFSMVSKSIGCTRHDPTITPEEDYRTRLSDGTKIRVAVGAARRPFGIIDLEPNEDGSSAFYGTIGKRIDLSDFSTFSRGEIPCGSVLGLLYFLFGRQ